MILGQVGKNFAAGMSGGIAYVLDMDSRLYMKVNKDMVNIERVTDKYDVQELKNMIQEHVAYTNSEVGKKILDNFKDYLPKFKKIIPEDYEKMMAAIIQMEEKGLSREKAKADNTEVMSTPTVVKTVMMMVLIRYRPKGAAVQAST